VSFGGLIFIETAHLYPIVFFTVASALSNIDSSQEQVARILGAGRLRTAIAITLPLVLPAIASGVLLVALDVMSSFGAPATIGTMANFSVLTTKIYDLLAFPPKLEFAAAGSLPIVAFALLCLFLQKRLIKGDHYHTLLGKSGIASPIALGLGKGTALLFCALIAFATAILPMAALAIQSMLKAFGTDITLGAMTMKNFETLIDPSFPVLAAIRHSLSLASLSVAICLLLGVIFAWIVERTSLKGRRAITTIIVLTYGFPAMIFAIATMLCYLKFFYGTFAILLIPYVAKNLPVAFTLFVSGLKQAAPEFEEAAHVAGAGWKQTMIHVSLPLLKSSAWVSAMLIFALALRELSMSAILTQPRTAVMSTVVLGFLETGAVEMAAAVSLVIVVLCLVALLLAKAIFRERVLPRVLKRMADGRTADP
jgi:iron(III) transport system permease protein